VILLEDQDGNIGRQVTSDLCEQMLQRFLRQYDSAATNFEYHLLVAKRIFTIDRRIRLPKWLVGSFEVGYVLHDTHHGLGGNNDDDGDSYAYGSCDTQGTTVDSREATDSAQKSHPHPAALLSLYVSFGLLEEAGALALKLISIQREKLDDKNERTWLPYATLDRLLVALATGAATSDSLTQLLHTIHRELKESIEAYSSQLAEEDTLQ